MVVIRYNGFTVSVAKHPFLRRKNMFSVQVLQYHFSGIYFEGNVEIILLKIKQNRAICRSIC